MNQPELFPELNPPSADTLAQFPEEMRRDFSILMGHPPGGEPLKPNVDHHTPSAQERFLAERAKQKEKVKRTITGAKIVVLDLATEEGRAEYEKFMTEIIPQAASDQEHWRVTETHHPLVLDTNTSSGYRLLVTLRYCQCDEVRVPGDHGFTVVPRADAG